MQDFDLGKGVRDVSHHRACKGELLADHAGLSPFEVEVGLEKQTFRLAPFRAEALRSLSC